MSRISDVIRKVAPFCHPAYLAGFDAGDALFQQYGITTPIRQAQWLGQFGGETAGGTILYESGEYHAARIMQVFGAGRHSAAIQEAEAEKIAALPMPQREHVLFERVYGGGNPHLMNMLGNRPGDGWAFRGTGPLQSTGRGAAKRWGDKCGTDFCADTSVMIQPQYVLLPPLLEWDAGNLNRFADVGDIRHIRRYINGGYNGLQACIDWEARFWTALKDPEHPAASWQATNPDPQVYALQNSLNLIGYTPKITTDGRYGPATKAAIAWFQALAGLKADGIAGPVTVQAINLRFATRRAA